MTVRKRNMNKGYVKRENPVIKKLSEEVCGAVTLSEESPES